MNEDMKNPAAGGAQELKIYPQVNASPPDCQRKNLEAAGLDLAKSLSELRSFLQRREIETLQENIKTFNLDDIMKMEFPPIKWLVPDILTEGVSLLAAPPKAGKSFLGLDLATSIAMGGVVFGKRVEQRCTLYIALEDTLRRIQSRVSKQMCLENAPAYPTLCRIVTQWPTGADGIVSLHDYALANPELEFIIIDTYGRFSPARDNNDYIEHTGMIAALKEIATKCGFSILLIHHTRKHDESLDFINRVLGSIGITGGVDNILLLNRKRGQNDGILSITGRDIEEQEYAVTFDTLTCRWSITGSAAEVVETKERKAIIDILKTTQGSMTPKDIAGALQKNIGSVKFLLSRMVFDGQIIRLHRGEYIPLTTNSTILTNDTHYPNDANHVNYEGTPGLDLGG
jgi:hypothetical protein